MTTESAQPPLRLEDLDGVTLRASDAFLAMGRFLGDYSPHLNPQTALVVIRSGIEIEEDHMSADPAALADWLKCVQEVLKGV